MPKNFDRKLIIFLTIFEYQKFSDEITSTILSLGNKYLNEKHTLGYSLYLDTGL